MQLRETDINVVSRFVMYNSKKTIQKILNFRVSRYDN